MVREEGLEQMVREEGLGEKEVGEKQGGRGEERHSACAEIF